MIKSMGFVANLILYYLTIYVWSQIYPTCLEFLNFSDGLNAYIATGMKLDICTEHELVFTKQGLPYF